MMTMTTTCHSSNRLRQALILMVLGVFLCHLIPAAAQENSLPPTAPIGSHPRLIITQPYLDTTLAARLDTPTWQAFKAYVDSDTIATDALQHPELVVRSLALAWLLTGDRLYQDKAFSILQRLVNWIEDTPSWDMAYVDRVAALAVGYDWLYGALGDEDHEFLAEVLIEASRHLLDPTTDNGRVWIPFNDDYLFQTFSGESARWLWAITAAGLATQGDHPEAAFIVEQARTLWQEYGLSELEVQPNGAWAAGPYDGLRGVWAKLQTALAWWTARGEDAFSGSAWWYQRMAYNTLMLHPDLDYPAIIGAGIRNHPDRWYSRAQDLLLQALYPDTPATAWVNWLVEQSRSPAWLLVEEMLWYDPTAEQSAPDILTWRALGTNHVFMRSNWANSAGRLDPTATYVSFQAGDHFAAQQVYDQGSFTIWRAGVDLLVQGGIYSGTDTDANYYVRSIASNTVLICDLGETFENIWPATYWLNDCGQRPVGSAVNAEIWRNNRDFYETGNIERLWDDPTVTYIRADITDAYSAKAQAVIRELVYIRPGAVIVHDRLTTSRPNLTTLTTLHFNSPPQTEDNLWVVKEGASALYIRPVIPGVMVEPVAGYITAGQTIPFEPTPYEANPSGYYRLDIFSPLATTTPWFLTGLVAVDSAAAIPYIGGLIDGESMRGLVVSTPQRRWQVMFDDDPLNVTSASFSIEVGVDVLLLTGLAPETTYTLQWADGRQEQRVTQGAGTLSIENPMSGIVSLR